MTATLICLRPPTGCDGGNILTPLPTREAAAEALRSPMCGPECHGAHLLAWGDASGKTHVVGSPPPPPPPLEVELASLYPRPPSDAGSPEHWRTPPELNEPLGLPQTASPLPEREEHAALLRRTAVVPEGPPICPLPDVPAPAGVVARTCQDDGCSRPHLARGFCQRHYARQRRRGLLKCLPRVSAAARFWSHVDRTADCWVWTAGLGNGYGYFRVDGQYVGAHRIAWEMDNGPVPKGRKLARRPSCPTNCVRPNHWHLTNRRKPCPLPTEPKKPETTPTPAPIPAATRSPTPWRQRWLPQRASS
jgi:hypothetical protein